MNELDIEIISFIDVSDQEVQLKKLVKTDTFPYTEYINSSFYHFLSEYLNNYYIPKNIIEENPELEQLIYSAQINLFLQQSTDEDEIIYPDKDNLVFSTSLSLGKAIILIKALPNIKEIRAYSDDRSELFTYNFNPLEVPFEKLLIIIFSNEKNIFIPLVENIHTKVKNTHHLAADKLYKYNKIVEFNDNIFEIEEEIKHRYLDFLLLRSNVLKETNTLALYKPYIVYNLNEIVLYKENLYVSLINNNVGNNPITSKYWTQL